MHATDRYGPTEGLPELREAILEKLAAENGLTGVDVMVTAGANQVTVQGAHVQRALLPFAFVPQANALASSTIVYSSNLQPLLCRPTPTWS